MYLSGLGTCDEVNAMFKNIGPWRQSLIDEIWVASGRELPAPILPASMEGMYVARPPRGKPIINSLGNNVANAIKAIKSGNAHPANAAEMDFLNLFVHWTADPCRKLTPVQKVADAIIKVATIVVPTAGAFQAATDVVNVAAAKGSAGEQAALVDRVMTPAINAQLATDAATAQAASDAQKASFDAQLKALQSQVPTTSLVPASSSVSQISLPTTPRPAKRYFGMTEQELIVAALALLGVAAIYRSAA